MQPGQTIGHILLLYGYTWDEYPYLLEINGMSEADRLNMQPGSVILVPPQDGTYTPAPANPTAKSTEPAIERPTAPPTELPAVATETPTPIQATKLAIRFAPATPTPGQPQPARDQGSLGSTSIAELALIGLALLIQLAVLAGAVFVFIRRSL